jgi:hypothetical protein
MSAVVSRARWNEDSIQACLSMAGRGLPAWEIADHLGVTRQAVMKKIAIRLGIPKSQVGRSLRGETKA